MVKVVGMMDVRQALHDDRFCNLFPEMQHEIDKYRKNPSCGTCSIPLAQQILNTYPDRVQQYFPNRKVVPPKEEAARLGEHHFTVINCHVDELQGKLRALPVGSRMQIAVARYQDQVTVIINELMQVF